MFTVRVEKTTIRHIDANWCESISVTGDVITTTKDGNLCKFSLQQDGSFSEQWRRQLPKNNLGSDIYLTDTGDIIIAHHRLEKRTIFWFDQDMKLIDLWQHEGYLIACLPGPRTVYRVRKEGDYYVEIRNQKGEVIQLNLIKCTLNDHPLSVCEDGKTGKLAVISSSLGLMDNYLYYDDDYEVHYSLHIFSGTGKALAQFTPPNYYADMNV